MLSISRVIVVDVGIPKRATSNGITADTDGCDLAHGREQLKEHRLGDLRIKLAHVERGRVGLGRSARRSGGGGGSSTVRLCRRCRASIGVDGRGISSSAVYGRGGLIFKRQLLQGGRVGARVCDFGRHDDLLRASKVSDGCIRGPELADRYERGQVQKT